MCGISCILALQNHACDHHLTSTQDRSNGPIQGIELNGDVEHDAIAHELDASLEQIKHRGPDSRGQWISPDKRCAFGHVRLAINDLSPDGAQPFHSADGSVHAVVNGEFYDYDAIRADLLSKTQYHFRSRSDSELIIALYSHYGLNFVHYLRGEFACVLFDEDQQLFIAVRDRYGIKPLFWTVQEGRLLVAAEIKAFLPLGWKTREWDVRSLLDGGWNHDERTIFNGINKIRPGHYLTCQSFGHIEQRAYWDLTYPDKRIPDPRTPDELIQGVRERLLESIRLRLRADVPVGIYLSGGIDSSVIAGMVTHLVKEQGISMGSADPTARLSCFSIAFDESSGFDESAIANRTAEWLGVKYIKKHMNEAELARRFEDATWHAEHHNPDFNYVGKYALSEVPYENGYKVVLTGEGADEQFAGYPVFLPDYLKEPDPSWTSYRNIGEGERAIQYRLAERQVAAYYKSVGADVSNRKSCTASRMLNDISIPASMAAFQLNIFAPWTAKVYGNCNPQNTIANNVDGRVRDDMINKWHPLNSAMYVWQKGHLANLFLTCLGDRGEMAHSVEARTPFLDHEFTTYCNNLPPSAKIRWRSHNKRFVEKWVLREAAKPFITQELYERKKHPYSAPTTWPRDGPLHKLLAGLLVRSEVEKLGFVAWEKCQGLVDKAFGESGDPGAMRFCIVLAQWVVLGNKFGIETALAV
ncbi:hypothetical protein AAFC00_006136 [Neodothiora populina]|uniref:Glutamine amidotransferase type-2 domain-containing protein n=1 Tax=Neodothiora populina TaxID=2781224 RepID=A0ABR3P451_9PEZI